MTVYFPCNKTRPIWDNVTHTGDCRNHTWLVGCVEDCRVDVHSKCVTNFAQTMSCASISPPQCIVPVCDDDFNITIDNATSESSNCVMNNSSTNGNSTVPTYNTTCLNETRTECVVLQNNLCGSLAGAICADGPEYDTCMQSAVESYRLSAQGTCLEANNKTCMDNQWTACFVDMEASCRDKAEIACDHLNPIDPEYIACYDPVFSSCYEAGLVRCQNEAEVWHFKICSLPNFSLNLI